MSKERRAPQRRERKKVSPCKCVRMGMQADLTELVETVTRVLWKSTEGMEDWDEWRDIRNALMNAAKHTTGSSHTNVVTTIADFDQRRAKLQ